MGATKPNQPVVAAIASFKLPAYWQVPGVGHGLNRFNNVDKPLVFGAT